MKTHLARFALAAFLFLFLPKASHHAASVGNDNPTGVTGEYNGSVTTGGSYDPYTGNAKRIIDDLTVTGSVGAYPLKWTRILNTRGISTKFGGGGGWSHGYYWGLSIAPPPPNPVPPCWPDGPDATVYYPDGAIRAFRLDGPGYIHADLGEPGDQFVHVGGDDYDLWMKDGGRVEFRTVNGYRYVAKYIVDPYGQRTTLEYASGHLWKVIEPAGRYLEIHYTTYPAEPGFPASAEMIDNVKAYDGPQGNLIETVTYQYTRSYFQFPVVGWFRFINLTGVSYDDTTHAAYSYLDPAPLHPTDWSHAMPPRVETCDDPRFNGAMRRIKYEYTPPGEMVAGDKIHGHIKAERNMTTNDIVSHMDYPNGGWFTRVETRGDGATRTFEYSHGGEGELVSYTDFAYSGQVHYTTTISFSNAPNPDHYFRTMKDARLHPTTTEKERTTGAVMAVIHPNGSSIKYTYDPPANAPYPVTYPLFVASKEDERAKVTFYDRDGANRIWRIRYPDDGVELFTYDNNPFGLVHEHTMTSGGTEVFTYDSRGRKETYTPPATLSDNNPGAHPTRYFYYDTGPNTDRLRYVVDPLLHATWYEYNGRGQVTKVTHQDGTFTQSKYNGDGTLAWTADENHPDAWMEGHAYERTSYQYDEYRRVTKVINPLLKETSSDYIPPNGRPLSHTTSSVYHLTSQMGKVTEYDYDANFRRKRMTVAANNPGESATTTYAYDPVGNLETVKDPKGQASGLVTTYHYNDRNWKESATDPLNHTTSWLYDDAGNKTSETRADMKARTWDEYDPMNRVKQTTGFLHEVTHYEYDHAGNLRKMTDANGGIYETMYDELNRKSYLIYPPDAATNNHQREYWRYDIAGNLLWYMNTAFKFKHFEYDSRNRQWHSYWNNSQAGANVDQMIGDETLTGFDPASRVDHVRTNGASAWTLVEYGYDAANHKIWERQSQAGGWPIRYIETLPDDDGNRGTLSVPGVPGDYSFTYQYTQRGQLWHISRGGSPYFEYGYDKNSNLTRRQHLTAGAGQDSTEFIYDEINRVQLCTQKKADGSLFAQSNYNDYDLVNNLKSISRLEDGNKGELFQYDDANQLKSVTYKADVPYHPLGGNPGGTIAALAGDDEREAFAALEPDPDREPLAKESVGIDAYAPPGPRTVTYQNDSITRRSMDDSGTVTTYTPNHLNQYTGITGYAYPPAYDTNFNLSFYMGWNYVYDADKRLTSVTGAGHSAQFIYDGLGRCVRRTVDGETTVITYDEWKPIVEWKWVNGASQLVAWNLYGPGADEILVRNQPSPAGYMYYHLDAMGNVQFLLSDTLQGLEKYSYDVFGKPTITGGNGEVRGISNYGNRFLFTGREYIYTFGLYDYRRRMYLPHLGRFIQTDPIGFEGDSANLYRYCNGNPIGHSDPMGLNPEPYRMTHLGGSDSGRAYDPENSPAGVRYTYAQTSLKKDEGPKQSANSPEGNAAISSRKIEERVTAAVDEWAPWAKEHDKEVAGTIASKGEIIPGPEKGRTQRSSDPGKITGDTVAIWHIHLLLRPNPYIFSFLPYGTDRVVMQRYPNIAHYVGVLNAPPGQFTIFGESPELPFFHYLRLGPQPFPKPDR